MYSINQLMFLFRQHRNNYYYNLHYHYLGKKYIELYNIDVSHFTSSTSPIKKDKRKILPNNRKSSNNLCYFINYFLLLSNVIFNTGPFSSIVSSKIVSSSLNPNSEILSIFSLNAFKSLNE